jgi:hypothetical protein
MDLERLPPLRDGVLAQLVERLNGIEEVRGSNPLGSTPLILRGGAAASRGRLQALIVELFGAVSRPRDQFYGSVWSAPQELDRSHSGGCARLGEIVGCLLGAIETRPSVFPRAIPLRPVGQGAGCLPMRRSVVRGS